MKNINILIIVFILITACQGMKEVRQVLSNEKTQTTDEFLVEKKEPLVLPPNYKDLPEPGTLTKDKDDSKKIQEILNSPQKGKEKKFSTTEKSILDRISK